MDEPIDAIPDVAVLVDRADDGTEHKIIPSFCVATPAVVETYLELEDLQRQVGVLQQSLAAPGGFHLDQCLEQVVELRSMRSLRRKR